MVIKLLSLMCGGFSHYFCWSCVVAESLNSVITYFDAVLLPVQQSGSRQQDMEFFCCFFFFKLMFYLYPSRLFHSQNFKEKQEVDFLAPGVLWPIF